MKSVLITGCSGFVGRKVAETALKMGYKVLGVDTHPCQMEGVEFSKVDITDREEVNKVISNVDAVIHLAAVTSNLEFERDLERSYDINVNGFLNVISAAATNGCKKFVYASSAAVYMDSFSEDSVIDMKKQKNNYAKTKLINEAIAASYEDVYGMRTTGLRYFNVYGEGENRKGNYASIITIFLDANSNGMPLEIYGNGKQARDLINVSDVAKITMMLLENGKHPIYNVGTGKATSYEDIANAINKTNKKYINNPLSSYQYLTRADTGRLRKTIGDYKFIEIGEGINKMIKQQG